MNTLFKDILLSAYREIIQISTTPPQKKRSTTKTFCMKTFYSKLILRYLNFKL